MTGHTLVCSSRDPAGRTLLATLKSRFGFQNISGNNGELLGSEMFENVTLLVSEGSLLEMESLDETCPDSLSFVFLSRHSSQSRVPALTSHSTGNFAEAAFGGREKELGIAFPSLQKEYMKALFACRAKAPGYDVVIEATHHGPTGLRKPALFVELGSCEDEWADSNASLVICENILAVLKNQIVPARRVAIGFGGTHYPEVFNRMLTESDMGFAAIASKHNLDNIDEKMVEQMIARSAEKVTHAVLDGKSVKRHRTRIAELATHAGLELIET